MQQTHRTGDGGRGMGGAFCRGIFGSAAEITGLLQENRRVFNGMILAQIVRAAIRQSSVEERVP
jgi:hypothetical protein